MQDRTLSPAEWEVMNVIWERTGKTTVREVLEARYPNGEKAYTTIQTIMNILVDKGFLNRKKIGMVNFYSAKQNQSKSVINETKNFVKKVYNGSFVSLANFLVESGSLNTDEIENLKNLIDKHEREEK